MDSRKDKKRWAGLVLGCTMSLVACGQGELSTVEAEGEACDVQHLEALLDDTLDEALETYQGNTGWLMTVQAPALGLDFHDAVGVAPDSGAPLHPDATFRIASVTKPFVAAATLRLVEDGDLSLDDKVADVVPAPFPAILASGGYDPTQITVRHLLTHTSGLYDYATDSDFVAIVSEDPSRIWTREGQVHFAMTHGEPLGPPGRHFSYTDTGYLLLGAILESKTGQNLGAALRSLLHYDTIGLAMTWLEKIEPAPPGAPPHLPQYVGDLKVADIDPSMDLWGGGGLISTTADLERFFRALLTGKVFRSPDTLDTMTTIPEVSKEAHAGMGIFQAQIGSIECWAHQGAWGVGVAYCPSDALGVSVVDVDANAGGRGVRPLVETSVGIVSGCDDE